MDGSFYRDDNIGGVDAVREKRQDRNKSMQRRKEKKERY